MKTALITGANRGIGLELARQLKSVGYEIYAACRTSSSELKSITNNIIEGIDVTHPDSITKLSQELAIDNIDLLINCAGILEGTSWEHFDFDSMNRQFQVNTLGPLRITKALEHKLHEGSKVIMITSRMGSIADNTSGGAYGYRMSKSALNAASVSLSQDLKPLGIAVGIIHPGYVKTDMTEHRGLINTQESAQGIIAQINKLTLENSGTFWHQNGEILPW